MNPPAFLRLLAMLLCALWGTGSWAQGAPTTNLQHVRPGQLVHWQASNAQQGPWRSEQLRGKVMVVFVWSTDCAVCRSALPELRANAAGWKGKPFTLVSLNVDAQRADWLAYEALVERTAMPPPNLLALWLGTEGAPARLPLTLVVDAKGTVRARYEGRMAPQAWDGVAELLL